MGDKLFIIPILFADWHKWESRLEWHLQEIADSSEGEWLLADLMADMRGNRGYQRWVVVNENEDIFAFAITAILADDKKTCRMNACVGKKRELWMEMLFANTKVWAYNDAGSRRMSAHGRAGWKKDLEAMGFTANGKEGNHTLYELELE